MDHGFTEVSHFMYACLSLVMMGNRRGSAWQALGLEKGKQWREEALLAANLCLHKKIFLCAWEKSRGEKCLCSQLRAGFTGVRSCSSPSLVFSDSFASLLSHFLTAIPHSFPVCLLSFAPGHLHSHSQAPLLHQLPLNLSGSIGFSFCVCAVHILLIVSAVWGIT